MKAVTLLILCGAVLAGCTSSSTIRTSQNTAVIQTSAAPVCGAVGAAQAAQTQAAIETIKAGYDRYVIVGAQAANNVAVSQMPGQYQTSGQYNGFGGWNSTTVYRPGPLVVSGSHDQALGIRMFREGEIGAEQAVSARDVLGPKWAELVKSGKHTC